MKHMQLFSKFLAQITLLSMVVACALGINYISAANWTGPAALPPNSNVAAPVNVSQTPQVKDGNISVGKSTNTATDYGLVSYGRIRSAIGGVEFPDGTVQTSAGGSTKVYQQVFTSSGTYTPHAGLQYAQVEVVGGGGGGNNGGWTASGGGSGAYVRAILTSATIGASQAVTIGTGGAVNTAGGPTSVGALISAGGGGPGNAIFGDGGVYGGIGGVPGIVPVGGVSIKGNVGGTGAHIYGGGVADGAGAPSYFGGAAQRGSNSGPGGSGGPGTSNGGGGGGGGSGVVVITEYANQ